MSVLEGTTLLSTGHASTSLGKRPPAAKDQRGGTLRTRASVAGLVSAVRNPRDAVEGWWDGLTKEEREEKFRIETRKRVLYIQLRNAVNFESWKAAAVELDELEENNIWKKNPESSDYDHQVIQERLDQLEEARINCDVRRMVFLIRTSLTRNLGNMGNIKLYQHSHVGTKDLVEKYIESTLATLRMLLHLSERAPTEGFGPRHMMEQVLLARQAFGRSALLLSGGATYGMCHSGVLKALWEQRLLPRIISGASAGSIICSVMCTRTDEEVPELMETFAYGDLAVFEEEGNEDTVLIKLTRLLKYGSLFDISHLTRVLKELLGDITFQEAYNRTRRILNICVSSASLYELPRLLNYVTSPNVLIWSAVAASCSVPLVFTSASLLAKDPRTGDIQPWNPSPQKWIDGSVDNDLPMTRLAEMFNVNHFIVSQVNPHVVPFIRETSTDHIEQTDQPRPGSETPSWLFTMSNLAKSEVIHRMHTLIDLGIFPTTLTKTVSVLSQKYSGDITILPEIRYSDMPRLLSNPSIEFMEDAMLSGARATWPKYSRIRNHLAIELALDDTAQKLRERVVFSTSQADLRLITSKIKVDGAPRRAQQKGTGRTRTRKWSQSSEPDASTAETAKHGRSDLLAQSSHQKSTSLYAPSQRDIGILPANQVSIPNMQAEASPFPGSAEVTSSGAETSNIYTSDSYADQSSSSVESPTSPIDHDNHNFPSSYSVPATPAGHTRSSSYLNVSKLSTVKPLDKAGSTYTDDGPSFQPSAQETRYKSIFHNAKGRLYSSPTAVQDGKKTPPEGGRAKKLSALGLNIDMSGTRGIISRKKTNQ